MQIKSGPAAFSKRLPVIINGLEQSNGGNFCCLRVNQKGIAKHEKTLAGTIIADSRVSPSFAHKDLI
jgi:hypothetical protein